MALAVQCPQCYSNPVEVAKKPWFMYGLLLFAKFGSRTYIGCKHCVNQQVKTSLLHNFLLSWWCFPWGFAAPFVIAQNLYLLMAPNGAFKGTLNEVLKGAGLNHEDLEIDEAGLSGEQRKMLNIAYSVLSASIWADGKADPLEYERATEIVKAITGGAVPEHEILDKLEAHRTMSFSTGNIPMEYRVDLLRMAADIIAVDGVVAEAEIGYIVSLGKKLDIDSTIVSSVLRIFYSVPGGEAAQASDAAVMAACRIIGVEMHASLIEIKKRYRVLMMQYHPDKAGKDKEKQAEHHLKAQEINEAYELLTSLQRTGMND